MQLTKDPVAESIREVYTHHVDLENCEDEPLRHIQVVQPYVCLIAADPDSLLVRYASDNMHSILGMPWEEAMDQPLHNVLPYEVTAQIAVGMSREEGFDTLNPIQAFFTIDSERVLKNIIVHRSEDYLLIEVEPASEFVQASRYQQFLSRAIARIQQIREYENLFTETAAVIRQVTGYDRVMVYKFDAEFNGEVIAEAREAHLEPFEGLRYPHTDIPKQARDLYLKNRVRLISNINAKPSRIQRSDEIADNTLDLTLAAGRGVSPIHLEYLSYMGVNNSLSVAIVLEGKLWGLFALHHYSPRFIDYSIRNMLGFVGQIFSGHLSLQSANEFRQVTLNRNLARLAIGEMITKTRDLFEGLTAGSHNLLNMFPGLSGSVVYFENRYESFGQAPAKEDVFKLIQYIREHGEPENTVIYHNERIGKDFDVFEPYCDSAAGVMVIFLNPDFSDWIGWFRPGISQSVTWAGRPEKELVVSEDGTRRMGPRRSFDRYVETVEGCSAPWTKGEIDTALALRITILNSLMQRYTEVKQVNEQLKKALEDLETFSYTVSHDLRAPLRAINGYTEILAEDYGSQLDDEAHDLITKIHRGVEQMNNFITDILDLSRVGSGGLQYEYIQVAPLAAELVSELRSVFPRTMEVGVTIAQHMPDVRADPRMVRQLLLNLISNALKYGEAGEDGKLQLEVGYRPEHAEAGKTTYFVSNTGRPIPEEYVRTIFEMFSRLSTQADTEGTGVGLAIVERIVHRHGGQVWVTSDKLGVTFNFYL